LMTCQLRKAQRGRGPLDDRPQLQSIVCPARRAVLAAAQLAARSSQPTGHRATTCKAAAALGCANAASDCHSISISLFQK
jgi:hypothetical protein